MNFKISIYTTTDYEEIISSILFDFGASGVEIDNHQTLVESIHDKSNWDYLDTALLARLEQQGDNSCRLSGFFEEDILQELTNAINDFCKEQKIDNFLVDGEIIDPNEWFDNHKKYFVPLEFDKVIICPEWIDTSDFAKFAQDYQITHIPKTIIKLEHLASFGTGQHESTAMCIDLLCKQKLNNKKVIDIGCGTGILGIVASQLGAKSVTFVDYDEQSIKNTKANVQLNQIPLDKTRLICGSLLDNVDGQFDIILANLTADLLCQLTKKLDKCVQFNTIIIASGIINEKATQVIQAFATQNFFTTHNHTIQKGEWTAFCFQQLQDLNCTKCTQYSTT